jgi:RHS repeat-associated protein
VYYHDKNGNLTKTTADYGEGTRNRSTTFFYDGLQELTKETSPDDSTKDYSYDTNGTLTKLVETEVSQVAGGNSEVITTSYTYDYLGRKTKVIRDPGEGKLNLTTKYFHDSRSDLVKVTDAKNNNTTFEYDGLDRKTKVDQDYQDSGNTLLTTKYEYDGNSRVTKVIDDNDHATNFTYDSLNRLTKETLADSGSYAYEYDKADNVTKRTDPIGTIVQYLYDDSNRLTKKNISKGQGVGGGTYEEFQYDGLSRITKTLDDDSIVTLKYDSFSHVYETSQSVDNPASVTRTVKYEFDHEGNTTKFTYPDDSVLTVVPDDDINRMKQLKSGANVYADYKYVGPGGRVLERDYLNGMKLYRTYDAARRVLTHEHKDGSTVKLGFSYAYDDMDNRLYEIQTHRQGMYAKGDVFLYDKINQVTKVKYNVNDPSTSQTNPSLIEDFRYDGVWNRTKVIVNETTETSYTVNQVNEYSQIGNNSQTFDDNGNLHTSGLHGKTLTVTYDYENRPTQMVYFQTTVDFKYDPFGRKIEKKVGNTILRYVYDDKKIVEEIDDASPPVIKAKYLYGPGIDEVLAIQRKVSGVWSSAFYHENALGSIVGLTDTNKNIVEEYPYDVYGRVYTDYTRSTLRTSSGVANPYFFTGRRLDFETGTYDYRARYYDPWQGRFMQRDPYYIGRVAPLILKMPSSNLYHYVANNPVDRVDPLGLVYRDRPLIFELDNCEEACTDEFGFLDFICILSCMFGGGADAPSGGCTISECYTCCNRAYDAGQYTCPQGYRHQGRLRGAGASRWCPRSLALSCICVCVIPHWYGDDIQSAYCLESSPGDKCPECAD